MFKARKGSKDIIKILLPRVVICHQKYLNSCSKDEQTSSRFGTTWGWVINNSIFIFRRTIPLSIFFKLDSPRDADSRPGWPIRTLSFFPKSRPMEDLMLFFCWPCGGSPGCCLSCCHQQRGWNSQRETGKGHLKKAEVWRERHFVQCNLSPM